MKCLGFSGHFFNLKNFLNYAYRKTLHFQRSDRLDQA